MNRITNIIFSASTVLVLAYFIAVPSRNAFGVDPPPDGGYPNRNTAEGDGALSNLVFSGPDGGGYDNTATGYQALFSNTTAGFNTAIGSYALYNNTTGQSNTATGDYSLYKNTTGGGNTATGHQALLYNTTGFDNTANGAGALEANTTGTSNTATGAGALTSNTTGDSNTANGLNALASNISGDYNTATGREALDGNRTGSYNTATGHQALISNTTGSYNTADGLNALFDNTIGINNTACGYAALASNTTGSGNIAIGIQAGVNVTTGSNNIDIGNVGVAGDAAKIRIGKQGTQTATYVAGIYGKTVASGTKVGVMIDSTGKLGTVVSSARFKNQIKPMDKASEAILALKPVTFRYKEELDPDGAPQFGLIAEEVEKVNPDLVVRGEDGKVMTVRYEAVNAMLLNEFLKEHRKVEEQGATIAQMKKQIEALTATVQKVSEQIALSKSAPQLVANP